MSKLSQLLVFLLYENDIDLCTFNLGPENTNDAVKICQRLLNAWHIALKCTGGDFKLSKCYWTLQDYLCQDGVCRKTTTTSETIHINNNNHSTTIKHVSAEKNRSTSKRFNHSFE